MRAMDLKQHNEAFYRARVREISHGGSHVTTRPDTKIRPIYNQPKEMLRGYPTVYDPNRLFNGIAGAKRPIAPGDWLAPNSPISLTATANTSQPSTSCRASSTAVRPMHSQCSSSTYSSSSSPPPSPSYSSAPSPIYRRPVVYASTSSGYISPPISTPMYEPYSPSASTCREEFSPNSENAYLVDGHDISKKKKCVGSSGRQQEELCLVCGDRASGYHYNALTCEGCKGFFRRSITKNAVYKCKYGNHCDIDMYMRRKCQECRLKKCLGVGMRPECVVPEYQCAVKRKEKKLLKDKDKPNSTSIDSPEMMKFESDNRMDQEPVTILEEIKPISREQEELIHSLVFYQEQYEQPAEDDLNRVMQESQGSNEEGDLKFRQITEMTILTVQLIVEFAKSLPGFDKLLREDQITLLKACSSEVMMLRMARKYDIRTDSIVFANNESYTKDSYSIAGMGETIEDLLRFCRQMCTMKVDNAEYALLTAIVIFSGRPSLLESWKVEKIQEIYIETLKAYVDNRVRPNSTTIFARLLSVLTELRTLGNQNSEMCFALKLKSKVLPPFLSEIWDILP